MGAPTSARHHPQRITSPFPNTEIALSFSIEISENSENFVFVAIKKFGGIFRKFRFLSQLKNVAEFRN